MNVLQPWVPMPLPSQIPLSDPSGSEVRQAYLFLCGLKTDRGPPWPGLTQWVENCVVVVVVVGGGGVTVSDSVMSLPGKKQKFCQSSLGINGNYGKSLEKHGTSFLWK